MRENKRWNKAKSIDPKRVAKDAQVSDAYVLYNLLSMDAHPTVQTLNRYAISHDGREVTGIDLDPEPTEQELSETVGLACYGLVCVLVSGCKILRSHAAKAVDLLAREYLEMMKTTVETQEALRTSSSSC
jgi:hypothetical protein